MREVQYRFRVTHIHATNIAQGVDARRTHLGYAHSPRSESN